MIEFKNFNDDTAIKCTRIFPSKARSNEITQRINIMMNNHARSMRLCFRLPKVF